MKPYILPLSIAVGSALHAQTATDPNLGLTLATDTLTTPTTISVRWYGKQESHYIIEATPDLTAGWAFLPNYNKGGANSPMGIQYQTTSNKFFFRVWEFDPADIGTIGDNDSDGLPDKWEEYQFANLSASGAGDADSDGVTNADEYAGGTNPNADEGYTVTHFQATDDAWAELAADRIIDLEERAYFKIIVAPQLPTIKAALVRPSFSQITAGGIPIALSVENTQLINTVPGQSELRVTYEPAVLMALSLAIPGANDNDLPREKASYDAGYEDAATNDSNLTDSDAFMANFTYDGTDSVQSRGRASKKLGDFPIGPDSVRHAGWQFVSFEFGSFIITEAIPNQADFFYFSGHGSHASGELNIGVNPEDPANRFLGASGVKWQKDLDVVIIAGCSVLDINDYNNNSPQAGTGWKPGDAWSRTGPRIFLGYCWEAPKDNQGGTPAPANAVNYWAQNRESMGDIEAWRWANNNSFGRNACGIDVTGNIGNRVFSYYRKGGFPFFPTYTWTPVHESVW